MHTLLNLKLGSYDTGRVYDFEQQLELTAIAVKYDADWCEYVVVIKFNDDSRGIFGKFAVLLCEKHPTEFTTTDVQDCGRRVLRQYDKGNCYTIPENLAARFGVDPYTGNKVSG